jgi:DnaK suppressor protein
VATKKSPEPKAVVAPESATAPATPAKVSAKTTVSPSKVSPTESKKTTKNPVPPATGKAALDAPAKAIMEKTAPKTPSTSTKTEGKAPKAEPAVPTDSAVAKPKAPVKAAAKTSTAQESSSSSPDGVPADSVTTEKAAKAVKAPKVAKSAPEPGLDAAAVLAEKPAKAAKSAKPAAEDVAVIPVVKEPKESKKAVKPPTAKSIAADAISALAVATPSAAALAENAAKATKPTPAPTPRVAATPAKGSLVPITPRLVKLLKAPALNPDDPFDGIDELSEGQFLSQQQEVLTNERRQYESSANMLQAEADQLAADMEPGDVQFDDESGEGTGVSVERERDIAMAQKANETVDEIDRALHRIGIGTYGYCIECHEMIHRDRLRAMPFAVLCMKCKTGGLSRR